MKVKIYRTIGFILVIPITLGSLINICQPYKFQRFIANPSVEFFPSCWGILASIVFDPLLLAGILFLWRADVNQQEKKKSIWKKVLISYAILFLITILALLGRITETKIKSKELLAKFNISESTTRDDINLMLIAMGQYPATQKIIKALSSEQIARTIDETYELVINSRNKDDFSTKRANVQHEYESILMQLSQSKIPEDYESNPEKYPDFVAIFMEFYRQDLKVALVNMIYKSNYDNGFQVQWSPEALSAWKVLNL